MNSVNPNQLVPDRTNAIPCQYKGINFRSLLEARWAYFFDKLGFEWEYEPFELDGYIPDFVVKSLIEHYLFIIDVKPFFTEDYKKAVQSKLEKVNNLKSATRDDSQPVFIPIFASSPSVKSLTVNSGDEINTHSFLSHSLHFVVIGSEDRQLIDHYSIFPVVTTDNNIHFVAQFLGNDGNCSWVQYDGKFPRLYEIDCDKETQEYVERQELTDFDTGEFYVYSVQEQRQLQKYVGVVRPYMYYDEFSYSKSYWDVEAWEESVKRHESYWKEACNATQYKPQKPKQFIT